jgi:hypothetical protein
MTQGVNDLINAIASGDSVSIDAAFNAEMATRVSSRLEDMRVSVAQNMFSEQDTEKAEDEVAEVDTEVEDTEDAPVKDVAELGGVSEEDNA